MKLMLLLLRIVILIGVLLAGYMAGAAASGMMSSGAATTTDVTPEGESHDAASDPDMDIGGVAAEDTVEADLAAAAEALKLLLLVLSVCALETIVLAYPVIRSRWTGWKLIAAIFLVLFGVKSFQSQIEAIYFHVLPLAMSLRVMLMGAVIAAIFAPMAVVLLGKRKADGSIAPTDEGGSLSPRQWAWKLGAAAIIYVALYTIFGHFVAWQSDAVRAYYGSSSDGSGLPGVFTIPTLGPLQAARGLLWVALGLPVIRMMKGPWWEAAIATGLVFAVVMNAQLLLPNDVMPFEVRMVHLVETAPSNFLFGVALGWLFRERVGHSATG